MHISNETKEILSNFSNINDSMYFCEGSKVRTVSPLNTIYAEADINECFERDFGIYSLKMFLSVINSLDEPELSFGEDDVIISDKNFSIKYRYAAKNMIVVPPDGTPKGHGDMINFGIARENWKRFMRLSETIAAPNVIVESNNSAVRLFATDVKNSGDNVLNLEIDNVKSSDKNMKVCFNHSNMVMLHRDYDVEVFDNMANFRSNDGKLMYVIASETAY